MKTQQLIRTADNTWKSPDAITPANYIDAALVLVFWSAPSPLAAQALAELSALYPRAHITGCSTAGEIAGPLVHTRTITAMAVSFASATVHCGVVDIRDYANSDEAGMHLAATLAQPGLRHILVFSDGLHVNGSDLARGLTRKLPAQVTVTGGLAGDDDHFASTSVALNATLAEHRIVAVGLYGESLHIGFGSRGGWDPFGPERLITGSHGNVLTSLDGEPALDLYTTYLGHHASGLPATGLLFPLSIREQDKEYEIVRTILAVDRDKKTMTFAGDVPRGTYAHLMRANFDRLIQGAEDAAEQASSVSSKAELALLISCVGRKLVLDQLVEEEVERVGEVLGQDVPLTGFYSYGELAPYDTTHPCELHNQTMTITTIAED